jgi:LuxR family maltose regulon positive regulatory protein
LALKGVYHAKIVPPRFHGVIQRERLFKLLDGLADHPITWISSPAGSGKTTLIASYIRTCGIPALWYNVDEADADIATFFYYMAEAAKSLKKGRKKPLPLFTPEFRPGIGAFTRHYFESLFGRMSRPGAIVFDNYQDVPESSEIHEVIRNGLRVVPEGLRVFIVSRKTFPPPFVSLQAESILASLGWDDIRFTVNEVREMVDQRSKTTVSEALALRIHEETQGWATAIVLMMSQKEMSLTAGIEPVGYSSVFNYFAVEVFERLSSRTQRLLLGTAFLPSISPESGYQLAGVEESPQILADLNRNHCFVNRYGAEYHCHPLFREFLLSRVKESLSPEEIRMAQSSAGAFLIKSGQTEAAINLLMAARDWNSLITAILGDAPTLVAEGRGKTLEKWIQHIPKEISSQLPWLLYWLAVCSQHYDPPASYALFVRSFNLFEERNDIKGTLYAWGGAVHSIIFKGRDMKLYDTWIDWLDNYTLRNQPFPSSEIEANVASGMVGALLARHPDRSDLRTWLDKAHTLFKPLSAVAYMFLGDYGNWAMVTEKLEKPAKSGNLFFTICWYHNKASLVNETGPFHESTLSIVEEGLKLSVKSGMLHWVPLLLAEGFYAAVGSGQLLRSLGFLKRLESMLDGPPSLIHIRYHCASALYYILVGNVNRAITHGAEARRIAAETGFIPIEALTYIFSAFISLEAGHPLEARKHIAACQALPIVSSMIIEYSRLIAEAALSFYEGVPDMLDILREAFALGRREGYITPYSWWQPALMARLCKAALDAGIEVEYTRGLIRTHNLVPDGECTEDLGEWPWPCRVRTFGGFGLTIDDALFSLEGRKKPMDLLKVLISLGGDEVRQETIEDELWPEAEGDMARISFKTNLSRLRKVIGEKTVEVKDGKVSLNPQCVWLDLWALESLADKVSKLYQKRNQSKSPDEPERLAHLLFDIYRGDFLATDNGPWLNAPREKFRTKFTKMFERLAEMLTEAAGQEKTAFLYERAIEMGISPNTIHGLSSSQMRYYP